MQMQAGNDFLPNVPSLDIYDFPKSALDTLLESYKAVLPSSGYLTKGSKLVPSSLRALLNKLALDEQPAISRRQVGFQAAPLPAIGTCFSQVKAIITTTTPMRRVL